MKVILTAFQGKLRSDVMDMPEEINDKIDMVLENSLVNLKPIKEFNPYEDKSKLLRCSFIYTGYSFVCSKTGISGKEYALYDINKL